MPEISIIVPVYNVEKYIKECIDSILNQTYDDFELILVDDGSPDQCGKICDSYSEKDLRIKVIHQKNGGISFARNTGLSYVNGKYVLFIDSDDVIHRRMLEIMHSVIEKSAADVCYCDITSFLESDIPNDFLIEDISTKIFTKELFWEEWKNPKGAECIVVWNKLYKRSIFNEIRFVEGKIHEDVFILHKWVSLSNKIVKIELPLYYYRQRAESIMHTEFSIRNMVVIEALVERTNYFLEEKEVELAERTMVDAMCRMVLHRNLADESVENKQQYSTLARLCWKSVKKVMKTSHKWKFHVHGLVFFFRFMSAIVFPGNEICNNSDR